MGRGTRQVTALVPHVRRLCAFPASALAPRLSVSHSGTGDSLTPPGHCQNKRANLCRESPARARASPSSPGLGPTPPLPRPLLSPFPSSSAELSSSHSGPLPLSIGRAATAQAGISRALLGVGPVGSVQLECSRGLHWASPLPSQGTGEGEGSSAAPTFGTEGAGDSAEAEALARSCPLTVEEVVARVKGVEGSAAKVAAEVSSLDSLLRDTRRGRLKKIGLPCRQRKALLRALEKWRQGVWDPTKGVLV